MRLLLLQSVCLIAFLLFSICRRHFYSGESVELLFVAAAIASASVSLLVSAVLSDGSLVLVSVKSLTLTLMLLLLFV